MTSSSIDSNGHGQSATIELPVPEPDPVVQVTPSSTEKVSRPTVKRKRLTVYLPIDLLDRVRNAVYWTPSLTLAGLLERALTESLDLREEKQGQPFPQRLQELKGGRPRRVRPERCPE